MKKLTAFLAVLVLVCCAGGAFAENLSHISDESGVLSQAQKDYIEEKCDKLFDEYGIDIVVATTDDSEGKTPELRADDFYDAFRDYDAYPDGAALLFMFDIMKYSEAARGEAADILVGDLGDVLSPYTSQKDYAGALVAYVDYAVDMVTPGNPFVVGAVYGLATLVIGIVVGLIVTSIFKHQLLTARKQAGAMDYVRENSLDLRRQTDIFLFETVTRRKIEKENNSSSSTSSSGNSYSNRSGDL